MAYYIRKIAKSKWTSNLDDKESILGYRADAIANDLRTSSDTLSLWKVDSLTSENFRSIIAVNGTLSAKEEITRMYLLCIPDNMLIGYSIEQEDGASRLSDYNRMHYNIIKLTVESLLSFASSVVLKILNDQDGQNLIRLYTIDDILTIIDERITNEDIRLSDLNEKQQKQYIRWREKKK